MKIVTQKMLQKLNHKDQVRFALHCADQVKDKWKDIPEAVTAVAVTELWLEGKATSEECKLAANAGYAAANAAGYAGSAAGYAGSAASDAGYAGGDAVYAGRYVWSAAVYGCEAANAAGAAGAVGGDAGSAGDDAGYAACDAGYAGSAAGYAGSAAARKEQHRYYLELLNYDQIVEDILITSGDLDERIL